MQAPVLPKMPTFLWVCFGLIFAVLVVAMVLIVWKKRISNSFYYVPIGNQQNPSSSNNQNQYML